MFDEAETLALNLEGDVGSLREAVEDGDGDASIIILSKIQLTAKSLMTELHSLPVTADVGEPELEE